MQRINEDDEIRDHNKRKRWLRRSLKARMLGLASLYYTIARQHARVAGLKECDANAHFFKALASSRRRLIRLKRIYNF